MRKRDWGTIFHKGEYRRIKNVRSTFFELYAGSIVLRSAVEVDPGIARKVFFVDFKRKKLVYKDEIPSKGFK